MKLQRTAIFLFDHRLLIAATAILFALALVFGCSTAKPMTNGIPNLAEVAPGIWRGGQPTTDGFVWLSRRGVTNIVKLNPISEADDSIALQLGISLTYLPISQTAQITGVPAPATLDDAVAAIKPGTFIHCLHGEDRTGLVIALWRVRVCGWTKAQAHEEMINHGFHPVLRGLMWAWENEPERKPETQCD